MTVHWAAAGTMTSRRRSVIKLGRLKDTGRFISLLFIGLLLLSDMMCVASLSQISYEDGLHDQDGGDLDETGI